MRRRPAGIGLSLGMVFLLAISVARPATAEPGPLEQATALLAAGDAGAAARLLSLAFDQDPARIEDPAYLLAFADANLAYAPTIDPENGGGQLRVQTLSRAGESYAMALARVEPDSDLAASAQAGRDRTQRALQSLGVAAAQQAEPQAMLNVARTLVARYPDDTFGPQLMLDAARLTKNAELELQAMRAFVATGTDLASIYSYAAALEGIPSIGDGAEAALAHIDAGLVILPDDLVLLYDRARYLILLAGSDPALQDDARAAIAKYGDVLAQIEDAGERVRFVAAQGGLFNMLGDEDRAIELYQWVLVRTPEDANTRYSLAAIYLNQANRIGMAQLELPFEADPAELQALKDQERALLERAKAQFETTLEHDAQNIIAMQALASIYPRLDDEAAYLAIREKIKRLLNGEAPE